MESLCGGTHHHLPSKGYVLGTAHNGHSRCYTLESFVKVVGSLVTVGGVVPDLESGLFIQEGRYGEGPSETESIFPSPRRDKDEKDIRSFKRKR